MSDMNKQSKRFYEIIDVIKNLHDQKILNDDEFKKAKEKILK